MPQKNTNTDLQTLVMKNLENLSRDELQALYRELEELEIRENENKAKKYVPNGKCEEFINKIANGTYITALIAANAVGKTCVGANVVANICFGPQNEWFDHDFYRNFPHLKKGRIITDPTTIKEKIIPELKKWFPSNRYDVHYTTKKESKPYEAKWFTDTGFEFDIMSNEQDAKEFESADLGWVWFDEPPPKAIYTASVARTRLGGILFFSVTPLKHSAWMEDEIVNKADGVRKAVIEADVEDNCKQHGVRGFLEHQNIENMIAEYPDDERETRAKGKFGHSLGVIHKKFKREVHVIKPFEINYKDYTIVCALDTHPRLPEALSWMAIDRKGQKFLIHDLSVDGTDEEIVSEIRRVEEGLRVEYRIIDPSAFNDDKRTQEECFAERLRKLGLHFEPGSKQLLEGIRRTDEALKYTYKDGQMIKAPEIFFFENSTPNTQREFPRYVWDDWAGRGSDEKSPKKKPKDKDDHWMENLHRLLIANFQFIEPRPVGSGGGLYNQKWK